MEKLFWTAQGRRSWKHLGESPQIACCRCPKRSRSWHASSCSTTTARISEAIDGLLELEATARAYRLWSLCTGDFVWDVLRGQARAATRDARGLVLPSSEIQPTMFIAVRGREPWRRWRQGRTSGGVTRLRSAATTSLWEWMKRSFAGRPGREWSNSGAIHVETSS